MSGSLNPEKADAQPGEWYGTASQGSVCGAIKMTSRTVWVAGANLAILAVNVRFALIGYQSLTQLEQVTMIGEVLGRKPA